MFALGGGRTLVWARRDRPGILVTSRETASNYRGGPVFFLEFKFWGGKCLFGEGSWEAQATGRYAASCLGGSGGMRPIATIQQLP